jgi:hypothetical protein
MNEKNPLLSVLFELPMYVWRQLQLVRGWKNRMKCEMGRLDVCKSVKVHKRASPGKEGQFWAKSVLKFRPLSALLLASTGDRLGVSRT